MIDLEATMSLETVRQVLARAVAEPDFRQQLRAAPGDALAGYDLTDQETEALATATPETFDRFMTLLEPRLSHAVSPFPLGGPGGGANVQPTGF
jgi:hypothetical protein